MGVKNGTKTKKKAIKRFKEVKEDKISSYLDVVSNEILTVLLLVLAVFIYICLSKAQGLPEDNQFIGIIGIYLNRFLEKALGEASLLVAFYLLAWSIHIGVTGQKWSIHMWGISLVFISLLLIISVHNIPAGLDPLEAGKQSMGGGHIGGALAYLSIKLVGKIGTLIFTGAGMVMGLVMIVNRPLADIVYAIKSWSLKAAFKIADFLFEEVEVEDKEGKGRKENKKPDKKADRIKESKISKDESAIFLQNEEVKEEKGEAAVKILASAHNFENNSRDDEREMENKLGADHVSLIAAGAEKEKKYQKPPLDLLSNLSEERTIDKKNIKHSIAIIEETFANFGINVKVNQVSCGPAVTRYEVTPAPGVKVSKILSLTDDLQLNLAAPGIRIEAPIPGKSAIGIEVPNSKIRSVGLKSLLLSPVFKRLQSPLAFALGEDIAGNTVAVKLSDMPHLLIAGSTGSGKSVCLNCIIMSFLYNAAPDEVKFVFIDPKMVELTVYNGIPHLLTPVVTDPKKAALILRWMVTEMEKRYKLFSEYGVRDINRYNQVAEEKLPFIVIIIDELADLMMVAPVEVEDAICRLAQMARAAGMHLIVATQRPSVDVVTGVIKANIPSRIAFAVSSQADSRTILDCSGAEKLLGRGDMLFLPMGANKPVRVQGAYVSDRDIEATVEFIKENNKEEKVEKEEEIDLVLSSQQMELEDELFWEAVRIFVESGRASVSLLQRRLRIGYSRAARLVDMMEERGIVSEPDNNKKREVLIDRKQLEELYERHEIV
ncbi:FtsK/SpoIIIE family DNA translocase [Thermosyntropha lipolytica]|nr:DNA translocase FtsK [Thermosyntropha lipolytica]